MEKAREFAVVSESLESTNSVLTISRTLRAFRNLSREKAYLIKRDSDGDARFIETLEKVLDELFPDHPERAEDFILNLLNSIDASITEVQKHTRLSSSKKKFFIRKLTIVRSTILYPSQNGTWEEFLNLICDEELVDDLEHVGESMLEYGVSPDLSEYIDEIYTSAVELISLIKDSALSDEVKAALLASLESIISIIHKVQIYGADLSEEKIKMLLADVIVHYAELKSADGKLLNKISEFISTNLTRMRGAANNIEAVKTVAKVLGFDGGE